MLKDFKSFVFVSVDVKGLTDAFFVSVDVKRLSCIFLVLGPFLVSWSGISDGPLAKCAPDKRGNCSVGVKLPSGLLAITRGKVYHNSQ